MNNAMCCIRNDHEFWLLDNQIISADALHDINLPYYFNTEFYAYQDASFLASTPKMEEKLE